MPAPLYARVNGAGPTGAVAALALARAGWQVSLHDPLSAEQLAQRQRAYALTYSSRRLLQRLQLWEPLQADLVPFRSLQLRDLGTGEGLVFSAADLGPLLAGEAGAAVGWISQHSSLMPLLLERLAADPAIALRLGPAAAEGWPDRSPDGAPADLLLAADGPDSPTRTAFGIGQWCLPYRQACLTVQVELRGSPEDQAWELLRPEGPFALLPLGGRRVQVVWSAPQGRCRQLESLPDSAFLDALAAALPDQLQPDALLDQPRAFPVALQLARRLGRGPLVLVGESGHRCHPVGGQGLNLCWRDVETLLPLAERAVAGRLDPTRIARAYGRRRWLDLLFTLLATDLLVRLFSNRQRWLLAPRWLALRLLARSPLLRRAALAVMTHGPLPPLSGRAPRARLAHAEGSAQSPW